MIHINHLMKYIVILCAIFFYVTYSNAQTVTVVDARDGKAYKTIQIGSQIWMAQNLSTKSVEFLCAGPKWSDLKNCEDFLYKWEVAKNVCPTGWHLPSKEDFLKLLSEIGGDNSHQYEVLVKGDYDALSGAKVPG